MREIRFKRAALAGIASLALVGATVGAVGAQQPPTGSPSPTVPSPKPGPGQQGDRGAHHQQFINALAAKLNVTPERLQQAMTEVRNELGIQKGPGGARGPRGGFGPGLDAAAQAMNITADQLRQELPGKSLADVARAHNVDPTTVANALKNAANTRIDQAAAAGRLPSEQVAQAKQHAAQRIDEMMTRQVPAGGPPAGPRQQGPRRGFGAPAA
jgi:hypothetical protein